MIVAAGQEWEVQSQRGSLKSGTPFGQRTDKARPFGRRNAFETQDQEEKRLEREVRVRWGFPAFKSPRDLKRLSALIASNFHHPAGRRELARGIGVRFGDVASTPLLGEQGKGQEH